MAMDELTAVPSDYVAGTNVTIRTSHADFPASDGWVVSLLLRGVAVLTVAGTADGDDHLIALTPAGTSALAAGRYAWFLRAARGSGGSAEASILDEGHLQVHADPVTAVAGALQSHEEKELALIEAELLRRITGGALESAQVSGTAGGSGYTLRPTLELERRRDALQALLAARRRGNRFVSVRTPLPARRSRA